MNIDKDNILGLLKDKINDSLYPLKMGGEIREGAFKELLFLSEEATKIFKYEMLVPKKLLSEIYLASAGIEIENEFIKEIMLEKASLNLRNIPISLLDETFLDSENKGIVPEDRELIAMNIFYNSTKLKNDNFLKNYEDISKKSEFIDKLSFYICELNVLHPFNEGNGRALRLFFDMIVTYNGYEYINYEEALENNEYINASVDCMIADCEKIKAIITKGLQKSTL